MPTPPAPLVAPPPPLPLCQPPLALLVRAEKLTREAGDRALRMQVLRQLRAQYVQLSDADGASACEREIDALHNLEREQEATAAEDASGVLV